MNFSEHKDLENHLSQNRPYLVKYPVWLSRNT